MDPAGPRIQRNLGCSVVRGSVLVDLEVNTSTDLQLGGFLAKHPELQLKELDFRIRVEMRSEGLVAGVKVRPAGNKPLGEYVGYCVSVL